MQHKLKQISCILLFIFIGQHSYGQIIGDAFVTGQERIDAGIKLFDKGEFSAALEEYKKINVCDSNYHYAVYEMALTYSELKEYNSALRYCFLGLGLNTAEEKDYYDLLGTIYDYMDKQDSSIYYYKAGMKKFPYYHKYYFETAVSYIGKKNDSTALRYLIKSASLNPFHAGTHLQLAELAARNGHFTEAMLAYQFFLNLENNSDRAINALGNLQKLCNNNFTTANNGIAFGNNVNAELDEIIKSRAAQIESYKTKVKLSYTDITKQCQIVSEKYKYDRNDLNFYSSFYGKVFSNIWEKGYFVESMYYIFAGLNKEDVQSQVKKNEKELINYITFFYELTRNFAKEIKHSINNKEVEGLRYFYKKGNIESVGLKNSDDKLIGKWYFYYNNGILKSEGSYLAGEPDGLWKGYYDNGAQKSEVNWTNGKKNGVYKIYHTNGRLKEIGKYVNDELEGEILNYSSTGAIKEKSVYKNNAQNGPYSSYNYLGIKITDATFLDNKANGKVINYSVNGKVSEERYFKMGEMDGQTKNYYLSGKLEYIGAYKKGKKDSIWVYYYENGKKSKEGTYKDGKMVGLWTEYHLNGALKSTCNYNKNEELDGEAKYYNKKGQLYNEAKYKNKNLVNTVFYDAQKKVIYETKNKGGDYTFRDYYGDGSLQEEGKFKDNLKEGLFVSYYRNGTKYAEANLKSGKYEGLNTRFFPTGKMYQEFYCKEDEFDGYFKTYYQSGQVETEGFYHLGALVGPYKVFYKNGALKERYYYSNNEMIGYGDLYDVKGRLESRNYYSDISIDKTDLFDTTGKVIQTILFNQDSSDVVTKHMNGAVREKYKTKYGKRHGPYTEYHPNGKTKCTATYVYGSLNGLLQNFDIDGNVASSMYFRDGDKNGVETVYDENGKLDYVENYVNGKLNGKKQWFYENNKVYMDRYYVNGEMDSTADYYGEDGSLALRLTYDNGVVLSYTYLDKNKQILPAIPLNNETGKILSYYASGQKSREMTFQNGYIEGPRIAYFLSGRKYLESNFISDESDGLYKEYYINGQLKIQQESKFGENNGIEKIYYDNGQLKSECFYINDRKNGTERRYDKTGKLIKTYYYVNDYAFEK